MVVFSRMQVSDILQRPARGMVIQHVVGREQRHAGGRRDPLQPRQAAPVVAAIEQAGGKPHAIGAAAAAAASSISSAFAGSKRCGRHQHQQQAFAEFQQIIEAQMTFALLRVRRACRG